MGGGSEVESLRDESPVTNGWKESIPNPSRHLSGATYKTTTFPCSSLNRDGTLLSTCGLVVTSKHRQTLERDQLAFSSGGMGPNPAHPSVEIEEATVAVSGKNICTT